jgi:glyoxylase-like metal-dependent hydrolase (beta-lactamase superfamily II)
MSLDPGEPQRKLRGSYTGAETRPTRALAAGDMVGSLEVVAAPGHTPGHVAFFDRRDGTLLCGDTYTTMGRVATTDKVRLPFPLASMATWDPATELASARALRALDPAALAPGHGKIVDAPAAAMDAALAKASA